MDAMLISKKRISELTEGFKVYPQLLVNLKVTDKDLVMNDEKVIKAKDEAEAGLNGDGRVLLRKSGTEPLIRVMVEAGSDEKCKEAADKIIDAIKACGYIL
jgi:phosphoglucosamine mutase